jgi:hypothetical protein
MDFWSILHPFDIFYGRLVYFVVIWYILWTFGILYQENLATLLISKGNYCRLSSSFYWSYIWCIVPRKIWQLCSTLKIGMVGPLLIVFSQRMYDFCRNHLKNKTNRIICNVKNRNNLNRLSFFHEHLCFVTPFPWLCKLIHISN